MYVVGVGSVRGCGPRVFPAKDAHSASVRAYPEGHAPVAGFCITTENGTGGEKHRGGRGVAQGHIQIGTLKGDCATKP